MDEAGHTKAIFGLLVLNGVSSGHYAASFHRLIVPTLQNFSDALRRKAVGDAEQVHGKPRFSPHGIDIAECVGCRNLPKGIGIIYDRREEVHSLDHRQLVANLVDTGIIATVIPH